jgi:hypothetical protein
MTGSPPRPGQVEGFEQMPTENRIGVPWNEQRPLTRSLSPLDDGHELFVGARRGLEPAPPHGCHVI